VQAGVTWFCVASESNSAWRVMPSVASLACEKLDIDALVLGAVEVGLGTPGHLRSRWRAFERLIELGVVAPQGII